MIYKFQGTMADENKGVAVLMKKGDKLTSYEAEDIILRHLFLDVIPKRQLVQIAYRQGFFDAVKISKVV